MQVQSLADSSCLVARVRSRCYLVFGRKLFTDCSLAADCHVLTAPESASGISRPFITTSWDYDNPLAPMLADLTVEGRPIKAVVQFTKQAFAYVFDRVTGSPRGRSRNAPSICESAREKDGSDTAVPDQMKPPAFDRQGITGTVGGADWTGAAFDPETGRLMCLP